MSYHIPYHIPYDADEMEMRQRQLPEWERRLQEAEEALKTSKSSNYVDRTLVWSNTRDMRDYIKARIEAMLRSMEE